MKCKINMSARHHPLPQVAESLRAGAERLRCENLSVFTDFTTVLLTADSMILKYIVQLHVYGHVTRCFMWFATSTTCEMS